jgi:hypothetical protein
MGKEIESIYQTQREAGWPPKRDDITQTVTSIYRNPRTPTQIEADVMDWCREHHLQEMSKSRDMHPRLLAWLVTHNLLRKRSNAKYSTQNGVRSRSLQSSGQAFY